MSNVKKIYVLINGVTGYIGGSVLTQLLEQTSSSKTRDGAVIEYAITALVRKQNQADFLASKGVNAVLFTGLDDVEFCQKVAAEHDIVITAASGQHDASALAWIRGLAERQATKGTPCHYIHTGGTSVVGYLPVLGNSQDTLTWSDLTDFSEYQRTFPDTMKNREERISFFRLAEELKVRASIIVPPSIWGTGRGFFSTMSTQIAALPRAAVAEKQAIMVGQGNGIWNVVHINDLSRLYAEVVRFACTSEDIPPTSIYWAEAGQMTWKDTSSAVAKALNSQGIIATDDVKSVSVAKGAELLTNGDEKYAEAIYASSSVGTSDRARKFLGWEPQYGQDTYWKHFGDGAAFLETYIPNNRG